MAELETILKVENLKKHFPAKAGMMSKADGFVKAVDDISFALAKEETLGLVGESGCGKTTAGRVILRLTEATSGKVYFEGTNLFALDKKEMRKKRKDIQMIFQDPYSSLTPRMTVGNLVGEALQIHKICRNRRERKERVIQLFEEVGLKPEDLNKYPHEFSGGQRQRVGIARSLALEPKLIIADEPVSALDVSIQAQIINLMKELQQKRGLSYLFISHDLNIIENICHNVAVMYLGKIVEYADKKSLYEKPLHPYTESLLMATPIPDVDVVREKRVLIGDVPSPINPPPGCGFHTRCPYVREVCKTQEPKMEGENRLVACHHPL